jgi:hypothetical protein
LAGSLAHEPPHARGRKFVEVVDPNMEPALERMLSDEIAGDPMSNKKWVRSSLRRLSKALEEEGHQACTHTVARLLRKSGYSLQVNKKKQAGAKHPDCDKRFRYITSQKAQLLGEGIPVISVDTKKKELIGNYRREGQTWCREPIAVDAHFASYAQCVAVPFGIYDLARNAGYVTVGTSHNIDRRAGRMGSFARNSFVGNSEVGKSSLFAGLFLFDYGCCNRIFWGADQYTEVRIRDELLHCVAVRRQAGRKDLPVPRAHHDGAAVAGELVGEILGIADGEELGRGVVSETPGRKGESRPAGISDGGRQIDDQPPIGRKTLKSL